jgi:hypothetical protein
MQRPRKPFDRIYDHTPCERARAVCKRAVCERAVCDAQCASCNTLPHAAEGQSAEPEQPCAYIPASPEVCRRMPRDTPCAGPVPQREPYGMPRAPAAGSARDRSCSHRSSRTACSPAPPPRYATLLLGHWGEPNTGAKVAAVCPFLVQMWPSPGADVAESSQVPVQMWQPAVRQLSSFLAVSRACRAHALVRNSGCA